MTVSVQARCFSPDATPIDLDRAKIHTVTGRHVTNAHAEQMAAGAKVLREAIDEFVEHEESGSTR